MVARPQLTPRLQPNLIPHRRTPPEHVTILPLHRHPTRAMPLAKHPSSRRRLGGKRLWRRRARDAAVAAATLRPEMRYAAVCPFVENASERLVCTVGPEGGGRFVEPGEGELRAVLEKAFERCEERAAVLSGGERVHCRLVLVDGEGDDGFDGHVEGGGHVGRLRSNDARKRLDARERGVDGCLRAHASREVARAREDEEVVRHHRLPASTRA
mmetsp:Transcript_7113/g.14163  ORF Transcript_7113/g.14163 Transcript_7113/m.14163 type:complete len:213 (-) Transcript_7113:1695-2333(-)